MKDDLKGTIYTKHPEPDAVSEATAKEIVKQLQMIARELRNIEHAISKAG